MKKNGFILMLGGLLGVIIGLLIAPRKGEETREMISEKIDELKDRSEGLEIKKTVENVLEGIMPQKDEIIRPEEEIVISREFKDEEEEIESYGD